MMKNLLTRDDFREAVFSRDGHKCVVCSQPAKDAHHILERRLWEDEGYYLDNGVSLCASCHVKAETTEIGCQELRSFAGITQILIPNDMYKSETYDKWGNVILPNGLRLRGDLFYDESVQKILDQGGMLNKFTKYVKFPKINHLPWSASITDDDRVISLDKLTETFRGKEIVVSEKLDGECLDGKTAIITNKGFKTIEDICNSKEDIEVLSYDETTDSIEFNKVDARFINENSEKWYEIELEDGTNVILTENHRVFLPKLGCYRKVKDLSGDEEMLLTEK